MLFHFYYLLIFTIYNFISIKTFVLEQTISDEAVLHSLLALYKCDLVDDLAVLEWHKQFSQLTNTQSISKVCRPFVQWLQSHADDPSSSESDGEDDPVLPKILPFHVDTDSTQCDNEHLIGSIQLERTVSFKSSVENIPS